MGKHKTQRTSRKSQGMRRANRANRELKKIESKIRRWDRYKSEIASGKREGNPARWDTSGLKKRVQHLEGIVIKGSTTRVTE